MGSTTRTLAVTLAVMLAIVGSATPAGAAEHVVRPGEWLWSIARRDLVARGAAASDHDVRLRAEELYASNRDVVGPDPDVLVPGTHLRLDGAPVGGTYADARGLALDADGRAVAAGQRSQGFGVERFLPDGRLDPSFGGDGIVSTTIGDYARAAAVAIQPDGRIVVAGSSNGERGSIRSDVTVVRYLPDGRLDATFGDGGVVTTTVRDHATALDVLVLPDGRIVIAGSAADDTSGRAVDALLARYRPDGSLDPTFGQDGLVLTDVAGSIDIAEGLDRLPDGRLVIGGTADRNIGPAESDFLLAVYGADGDRQHLVTTDVGSPFDQGHDVVVDPGGDIVVAGSAVPGGVTFQSVVVRYTADGAEVDRTVTHALDEAHAVAVDSTGDYVLAGRAGDRAGVVRLGRDGTVEGAWADFGGERSAAFAVVVAGAEIVAAGCTCDGANTTYRGGFEIPSNVVVRRYR